LGSAQDLLGELKDIVGNATLLIYLDPFGLKGCEFKTLGTFWEGISDSVPKSW